MLHVNSSDVLKGKSKRQDTTYRKGVVGLTSHIEVLKSSNVRRGEGERERDMVAN
jgi:hypothetical protein